LNIPCLFFPQCICIRSTAHRINVAIAKSDMSVSLSHIHSVSFRIAVALVVWLMNTADSYLPIPRPFPLPARHLPSHWPLAIGLWPGWQDSFMVSSFERDNCAMRKIPTPTLSRTRNRNRNRSWSQSLRALKLRRTRPKTKVSV